MPGWPSRAQALASGAAGRDRRQALLGVATVFFQMQPDHDVDRTALSLVQVSPAHEVAGQRPRLIERPGAECTEELILVDQPVLEPEQSKEQVAVGFGGHGGASGGHVGADPDGRTPGPAVWSVERMTLYSARPPADFAALSLPPLWGRVRVGGLRAPCLEQQTAHAPYRGDRPPTLILPHKGGGD